MPKVTLLTNDKRIMMLPARKINFTGGHSQEVTDEEAKALLRLRENGQPVFKAEIPEPAPVNLPKEAYGPEENALAEVGQNVSGRPTQNALGI
jgi:hypothetical protein